MTKIWKFIYCNIDYLVQVIIKKFCWRHFAAETFIETQEMDQCNRATPKDWNANRRCNANGMRIGCFACNTAYRVRGISEWLVSWADDVQRLAIWRGFAVLCRDESCPKGVRNTDGRKKRAGSKREPNTRRYQRNESATTASVMIGKERWCSNERDSNRTTTRKALISHTKLGLEKVDLVFFNYFY